MRAYRTGFSADGVLDKPHAILALSVFCADTEAAAQRMASSALLSFVQLRSGRPGRMPSPDEAMSHVFTPEEQAIGASYKRLQIVGTPEQVRARIEDIVARTEADEVMIATHASDLAARVRSYELVAEAFDLPEFKARAVQDLCSADQRCASRADASALDRRLSDSMRSMTERPRDLTRTLLGVLCIGVLIAAALWIVRPFFAAGIWATTIVVVTWPLLIRMQRRLLNKRSLAAASMILMLVLVFVIPLTLGVGAVVAHADDIANQIRSITNMAIPPLPQWVAQLPLIGAGTLSCLAGERAPRASRRFWRSLVPMRAD